MLWAQTANGRMLGRTLAESSTSALVTKLGKLLMSFRIKIWMLKRYFSLPGRSWCQVNAQLLMKLARVIQKSIFRQYPVCPRVDEYDQPMREFLLDMLSPCPRYGNLPQNAYPNCTKFFNACKTTSSILPDTKTWLMGTTPRALSLLSEFNPVVLAFDSALADVVGLCDVDVDHMLGKSTASIHSKTMKKE